ncbi:MAG: DUF4362 domain-containing protein [Clostridium sp.]
MKRRLMVILIMGLFIGILIYGVQFNNIKQRIGYVNEEVVLADTKNIPFEYSEDKAIANGDVVIIKKVIHNKHNLDNFMNKVKNKKIGKIRVVTYTKGKDPLIENLYYNGDNIVLVTDNTRDEVIDNEYREIRRYEVASIDSFPKDSGTLYVATLINGETFDILYYEDIRK